MRYAKVNVWVYTSMLDEFGRGETEGYLYPSKQRYQTQLLIPYILLEFDSETDGTCRIAKTFL